MYINIQTTISLQSKMKLNEYILHIASNTSYSFEHTLTHQAWNVVKSAKGYKRYYSKHYCDIIIGAMASQITSLTIV